jgi:hypothetical protein
VAQTLHLEYTCTKEELQKARSLQLRKQVGGGSQWRTTLVLLVILGGMLLSFYFRVLRDISPANRPAVIAAVVVLCVVIYLVRKRFLHRSGPQDTKLDVKASDLTISGPGATVTMPWTAFSECLESPELFVLVDRAKTGLLAIPKRAFPSETWQAWFREQANRPIDSLSEPQAMPAAIPALSSAEWIRFHFKLGYRDYLDYTLASAKTWAIYLFVAAMVISVGLVAAANPRPHAIYTPTQMFFMFQLPFMFIMMGVLTVVISVHSWLSQIKYCRPQDVAMSDESLIFSGVDARGTVPWTFYTRYKETPWNFIVWKPGSSAWAMFPKRAFTARDDVNRCRAILARHLAYSRWFFA